MGLSWSTKPMIQTSVVPVAGFEQVKGFFIVEIYSHSQECFYCGHCKDNFRANMIHPDANHETVMFFSL